MYDDRRYTIVPSLKKREPEPETWTCKIDKGVRMVKVNDILRCPKCGSNRIAEKEDDTPKFITGAW